MISNVWVLVAVMPAIVAALRELVTLLRYRVQRASVDRGCCTPCSWVVDHGAGIKVSVDLVTGVPHRPDELA